MKRSRKAQALGFYPLLWLLANVAAGCVSKTESSTGGETHFLTLCDDSSSPTSCTGAFACVCNVCTLGCDRQSTCATLPGARCIATGEAQHCGDVTPAGYCEVSCVSDFDCSTLSAQHRCQSGVCRAGSTVGDGAGTDTPADASSGAPTNPTGDVSAACATGQISANEVLFIGDSFFALSHQVTAYLEDLARSAGALSAGDRYRDNSSLRGNTLALTGTGIADQYAAAALEANVEVVIMNAGGADALLGSCETADANCPAVADAARAAEALLADMAVGGVSNVIYVYYPDPLDAAVQERIDALRPLVQAACNSSTVPCHWLDLRPRFAGNYDDYIRPDGLNPTSAGAQATAEEIWALMQRECIAQ